MPAHPEPAPERARPRPGRLILAALAALALAPTAGRAQTPDPSAPDTPAGPGGIGVGGVVSSHADYYSGPVTGPITGVNINNRVGAEAFYAAGYTGMRSVVANIEAGYVWNQHETLTNATLIPGVSGTVAASNPQAAYDRHATWVGQMIAGQGSQDYQRGIAYGATLWSGSIASSWSGSAFTTSFSWNNTALFKTYYTAMLGGVSGQTADVVNSSWGFTGDSAGRSAVTMGIDALAYSSHKVVVFCAGNSGSNAGTVWGPATGYNTISVAALGSDTDPTPYNTVSSFSSRGPQDAFVPVNTPVGTGTTSNGSVVSGVRTRVDIAAPGQNLALAYYGGTSGGNATSLGGTDPTNGATNRYDTNLQGTSFAAPAVAAGAALLTDVAKAQGLTQGTDGRVVKAVLMNSADKTQGWDNGQTTSGGVVSTTQAVDRNVGAGRMNLAAAYAYYGSAASTRDVAGEGFGNLGRVAATGWDFGAVHYDQNNPLNNVYLVDPVIAGGSKMAVTLTWFAHRTIDTGPFSPTFLSSNTLADISLANLDLEVWTTDANGNLVSKVATSHTTYDNVEHLYFNAPSTGQYAIEVVHSGYLWNFDGADFEEYAVAWNFTPVPEPSAVLAVAAVVGLGLLRLRRAWSARRDAPAGLAA